jgi:hypothetical protein
VINSLNDLGPVFAGSSLLAPAAALVSAIGGATLWALTKPVIKTQRLIIARFFFILNNYSFLKTSPKYIPFRVNKFDNNFFT